FITSAVSVRLKTGQSNKFSLKTLCKGKTCTQAASTFFCLLVLKKQQMVNLHQSAPYEDIFASPGPNHLIP
uniref:Rad21/Rec8-like protein C-terminal eukaryotic domain-containing protein n=1 Tax=Sphaeramia orbicularis TaxID=375764 RepID=A0A672ZHV7_9TELE